MQKIPSRKKSSNRKYWLRLHKIIGLYSIVFIFLLAVSGLILSFTDVLKLEDRASPFSHNGLQLDSHYLEIKGDRIFIDDKNTHIRCLPPVSGIANLEKYERIGLMLACQNILYWLTWEGDVIESINLPRELLPLQESYFQETLMINTATGLIAWNTDTGELQTAEQAKTVTALPQLDSAGTNMAQWILNMHTGLIAGDIGRWLMRFAALGLILLCVSGLKNALRL